MTENSGHRIVKILHFCYGHRLLNYSGKCKNLHGHNAKLEVVIESSGLDGRGMVVDFSDIKAKIGSWLDERLDHRMVLNRKDPWLKTLRRLDPSVAVVDFNPTAENLARRIFEACRKLAINVVEVRLWETPSSCAVYKSSST